ncbi:hypothetical protein SDC9_208296 [bioreactor metagenome]|uniref:Uncharacterized protein n=1 Tax=bioreactor metagenome TaxID=1076179 RepID=A0A645JAY6_9ZZZZ
MGDVVDTIGDNVIIRARNVNGAAVGQVSAVGKVHPHDGVAGFAEGKINGVVCVGAAVGLYVGMIRLEKLLGPVDREIFSHIDIFAAAVVALAGIPFGILVGQHRACGGQNGFAYDVFGCDQLNVAALAEQFVLHGPAQLRVVTFEKIKVAYHV